MAHPYRQRHFYAGFYLTGPEGVWTQTTSGFYPGGPPETLKKRTQAAAEHAGAPAAQIVAVDFEAGTQEVPWEWKRPQAGDAGGSDGGDGTD